MDETVDVVDIKTVSLAAAQRAAEAALNSARESGIAVVAVVLNAVGQVLVVLRMDGVGEVALENATAKARGALTFRRTTAALAEYFATDLMLGPPMQTRPHILAVEGGDVLKAADGTVVGAIGISGAHHSQDNKVVEAAVAAFTG
jgi:uncharacterized protein GlcG (DUF336 family)